jgi:hypothetical protein
MTEEDREGEKEKVKSFMNENKKALKNVSNLFCIFSLQSWPELKPD